MSSGKRDTEYGRVAILYEFSFFDILKKGVLKVEEEGLKLMETCFSRIIVFQTIPFRN